MFAVFFAVCVGVWSPSSLGGTQLSWRAPLAFIGSSQSPATSEQVVSDYNTPSGTTSLSLVVVSSFSVAENIVTQTEVEIM